MLSSLGDEASSGKAEQESNSGVSMGDDETQRRPPANGCWH
jgi:hypothetical protein